MAHMPLSDERPSFLAYAGRKRTKSQNGRIKDGTGRFVSRARSPWLPRCARTRAPRPCLHLADPSGVPRLLCGQPLHDARLGFAFADLDESRDVYALAIADTSGKPAEACERCLALALIPVVNV